MGSSLVPPPASRNSRTRLRRMPGGRDRTKSARVMSRHIVTAAEGAVTSSASPTRAARSVSFALVAAASVGGADARAANENPLKASAGAAGAGVDDEAGVMGPPRRDEAAKDEKLGKAAAACGAGGLAATVKG